MKRKRISYAILATLISIFMASSFVSCKDYEDDLRSEIQATNSVQDALEKRVKTAEDALDVLEGLHNDLDSIHARHKAELDSMLTNKKDGIATDQELKDSIANLANIYATITMLDDAKRDLTGAIETARKSLHDSIQVNRDSIDSYARRIVDLEAAMSRVCTFNCDSAITSINGSIRDTNGRIDSLLNEISNWSWVLPDSVLNTVKVAADAKFLAEKNKTAIEGIDSLYKIADTNLRNELLDSLYANIVNVDTTLNNNINALDQQLSNLTNGFKAGSLARLEDVIDSTFNEHQEQFDSIYNEVSALNSKIDSIDNVYKKEVLGIKSYLNHLITGILIQGTNNPIYGSFALPTNTYSNVLAAYYGNFTTTVEFPTARGMYYVDPEGVILSKKDLDMMGITSYTIEPGTIVNDAADNAGTLYLTVNPTNVDFAGTKFEMVNSLDEAAGVELSDLEKSDKKLSFGWTRAGVTANAKNGFYETKVRINAEDVEKVKARINLEDLKDAFKDIIKNRDKKAVTSAVTAIYNNFTDVLDANAVKATWTDSIDNEEMAVYSQYALAATAIKPLSYNFGKDFDFEEVPYLNRIFDKAFGSAENFVGKIFDKINIPTFDTDKYKFEELQGISLSADGIVKATVKFTITIGEGEVFPGQKIDIYDNGRYITTITIDPNDEFKKEISEVVDVDITDMLKDIEGDMNEFVTSINKDLQEINGLMDEINRINDLVNSMDDIEKEIIDYLDRFHEKAEALNGKICNVINSTNKTLQPVILFKTSDGFARLSQSKRMPTLVNGNNVTLIPTSYTAEILAPAYKRLVGVSNVFLASDIKESAQGGNEDCIDELNSVNGQEIVGEVIDGHRVTIPVTLKKGYVYEFAYTSVDYAGYVVAKKCYIAVK